MKKARYLSIIVLLALMGVAGIFSSCKDEPDVTVLPRLFRPVNFTASTAGITASISWARVDSAVSYTLQISTDSLFGSTLIDTTTTVTSFTTDLPGATTFFARIRANASDSVKDSKFNETLKFSTPKENLFNGFGTAMTALNTVDVKWLPNASVTALKLTDLSGNVTELTLSASEITAGEKVISNLPNSTYSIQIYKNSILRGTISLLLEGDVLLNQGDDLASTITAASPGEVIILAPGGVFPIGSATFRFSQNVKIKGLTSTNKSVVCMTGATTATSSMLGFADGSSIGWVKFENIDFTGYTDNNVNSIKIGYLFNNNVLTTVGDLNFKNCNIHNFGNTPMRLQGSKNQVVDTLSFSGCKINDIGFSSTYAVVNSNSADLFNHIIFNNCIVYNFKGSLILRQNQTISDISITNCSINQGMLDPGSARYLIDTNGATFVTGITIQNCIFGSTGAAKGANGVRTTGSLTIAGSYFTSDYLDVPIPAVTPNSSITGSMTAYSGLSTDLWTDPVNGNFTIKDKSFAGKGIAGSSLQ